jgi:hypothetical protein
MPAPWARRMNEGIATRSHKSAFGRC